MRRGYRPTLIVVIAGLALANAAHKEPGEQSIRAHQSTDAPMSVKPAPAPQCVDEGGAKRDCAVASAQATVDQANYAFWQVVAGSIGVLLGAGTLIVAGAAAYWAKRAAEHTDRNASEAAKAAAAAISTHNAYLTAERAIIRVTDADFRRRSDDHGASSWELAIDVLNRGRSSAIITEAGWSLGAPMYVNSDAP